MKQKIRFDGSAIKLRTVFCILGMLFCTSLIRAFRVNDDNVSFSLAMHSTGSLSVAHQSVLNPGEHLTVEAWIKPSQTVGIQTIIDRSQADSRRGGGGYKLTLDNGRVVFTVCGATPRKTCSTAVSSTLIVSDRWQHVAAVFSPGSLRLFVDGLSQAVAARSISAVSPVSDPLTIGAAHGAVDQFHGLLDEVRISNTQQYQGSFSPPVQASSGDSVVGLWKFDGGTFSDGSAYAHSTTVGGTLTFSTDVPVGLGTAQFLITETPDVGPKNQLNDVVTIAPDNVWAVGWHGPASTCCYPATPVALRWNGTAWQSTLIPYPAGYVQGQLVSVDAAPGSNFVWALGTVRATAPGGTDRGWLLRWDGSEWSTMAVFSDPEYPQYGIGTVKSLAVINDSQIWIVGSRLGGGSWTLRYDGAQLATVPSPNADEGGNGLIDISAIDANNIYAAGSFMAIRWNGSEWQVLSDPLLEGTHLRSVAAVSPAEIWFVARFTTCGPFQGCSSADRIARYDGTSASLVPYEPFTQEQVILEAVSASSPSDAWVVGSSEGRALVLHLENGTFIRKQTQASAPSASELDLLKSVSVLSPTEIWTVGVAIDIFYDPQHREVNSNLALRSSP